AGGDERDQVERLSQPADNLAERGLAAPTELCRLPGRELRELGFELEVDATLAVHELEQRLRRQRIELRRQLALPIRQRPSRVEVREQALELRRLGLETGISGLRLLRHAFEPPLDVVAVRDEQLELERLEVIGGNARAGKAVENHQKRIHLAQVPEELRTRSGNVDDADGGRGDLP